MTLLRSLIVSLLIFSSHTIFYCQPRLVQDSCFAPSLGRPVHVNVLLPPGYDPAKRYPIIYLLHGWNGNCHNWTDLTRLTTYAAAYSFIIAMPDGGNSWYVNSLTDPRERYEDLITTDLPQYLRHRYSIDTAWQAIAGLSMGGYGALQLGLRHYARYRFVGVMSGGLDIPGEIDSMERRGRTLLIPSVLSAFGSQRSSFRDAHDPFLLIRHARPEAFPYIYLVTGIQEVFKGRLLFHRRFADSLHAAGIAYEYHETPGGHDFTFWDHELEAMLRRMAERRRMTIPAVVQTSGSK
jgi:putative tributyrin esterase